MSKTHHATPQQWAQVIEWVDNYEDSSCIVELLYRVQALEAAQQLHTFTADEVAPIVVPAAKPPTAAQQLPLVERMARALGKANGPIPKDGSSAWTPEARAALREVAAWLRSELLSRNVADLLDNEANR